MNKTALLVLFVGVFAACAMASELSEYSMRMAEEPELEYSQGPFALWLAEQERAAAITKKPITTRIKGLWRKGVKSLKKFGDRFGKKTQEPAQVKLDHQELAEYSLRMAEEPEIEYSQGPFALWLEEQVKAGAAPQAAKPKKKSGIKKLLKKGIKILRNFGKKKAAPVTTVAPTPIMVQEPEISTLRMAEEPEVEYSQGPFMTWLAEQEKIAGPRPVAKAPKKKITKVIKDKLKRFRAKFTKKPVEKVEETGNLGPAAIKMIKELKGENVNLAEVDMREIMQILANQAKDAANNAKRFGPWTPRH